MASDRENSAPDRGFNFVSVDPSAAGEKADSRSLIRANAGRYIWQQRRQTGPEGSKSRPKKWNGDRNAKNETFTQQLPTRTKEAVAPRRIGGARTILMPPSGEKWHTRRDTAPEDQGSLMRVKKEQDEDEDDDGSGKMTHKAIHRARRTSGFGPLDLGLSSLFASYPSDLDEPAARKLIHYAAEQLLPSLIPLRADADKERKSEFWLPLAVNHPALFSSIMYGTATHEQGRKRLERPHALLQTKQEQLQIMIAEGEAIRRINRALHDPSQALADEMILAIMTVAFSRYETFTIPPTWRPHPSPLRSLQWLDVYCSLDLDQVHVLGLFQVVGMKGGLENIKIEGLAETLSFAGIMLATRALLKPSLPYVPLVKTNSKGSYRQPDWPPRVVSQLSTYGDDRDFHQYLDSGLTEELADILQDMYTYSLVIDLYSQGTLKNPSTPVMADRRNSIQYRIMSLPSITEYSDDFDFLQSHRIYEPCRLATMIYSLLTVFPVPPTNAPLPQLAHMLRLALIESDPRKSWRPVPDLLLWVLFLGGIGIGIGPVNVVDLEAKSWFVETLHRLSTVAKIRSWNDLKRVLNNILWLDCLCDADGEALWDEVLSLGLSCTP